MVVRDGQQMGVCVKKLVRFAPPSRNRCPAFGIACMDPSTRSWSSVVMKMMFF